MPDDLVERAIRKERKRCEMIALRFAKQWKRDGKSTKHEHDAVRLNDMNTAAHCIATAIRQQIGERHER